MKKRPVACSYSTSEQKEQREQQENGRTNHPGKSQSYWATDWALNLAEHAQALCTQRTGRKPCTALKLMVHHDVQNSCVTSVCPLLQAVSLQLPATGKTLLAHLSLLKFTASPQRLPAPCAFCNHTAYDHA